MADPDAEDLISLLPSDRDYGERTYDDVVREVHSGGLILLPGAGVPIIMDAESKTFVKGTGRRPGSQELKINAEKITALFSSRIDEVDQWFFETLRTTRDPRLFKIFYERAGGHPGQSFGGMAAGEVLEMMAKISGMSRPVTIDADFQ